MSQKKQKILVIDDDPELIEFMENLLKINGYEVIVSCHSKEGIQKAKREKPDLILLDFIMPGLSGLEVLRQIKLDPATKQIPVLMMSSVDALDIITNALKMGADDYIIKPFEHDKLIDTIEMTLERQENSQ